MFRFLHILCLIIAIKWTLCYDYFSDNNLKYKYEHQPFKKERTYRQRSRYAPQHSEHKKRPEYEVTDEKDPIAHIDLTSFIHKPDEYGIEDSLLFGMNDKKSQPKLKSYEDYAGSLSGVTSEDISKINKRPYSNMAAQNADLNPKLSYKDSMNNHYFNYGGNSLHGSDGLKMTRNADNKPSNVYQYEKFNMDTISVHKPEKKCAFKRLKFPFFSHSKNESLKLKKDKKRKIFCFNCIKKENKDKKAGDTLNAMKKEDLDNFNILAASKDTYNYENFDKNVREKREEWSNDKERQLKELEELQKKIDGVEISSVYNRRT